jgi:O-antigen/teichoic acid export membrane protein
LAIAIRWPVSILGGFLAGAERFDLLNLAKVVNAVISFVGMVVVLLTLGSLPAVAAWTVLAALVECALYLGLAIRVAGGWIRPEGVIRYLGDLWRYARGIAVIAALSLVLTQADRVLLARLVPAGQLGEYAAAYNLVFGLTLIQLFVGSAMYPSFAADFAVANIVRVRARYRDATQAVLFLYAVPFAVLVLYGQPILAVLLTSDAAQRTAGVLTLLAAGFLFNAATAVPYSLALAAGILRVPIAVNAMNALWYLPLLGIAIISYGPVGAAAVWLILNASYLVTLVPIIQRRLLGGGVLRWVSTAVLPFPLTSFAVFASLRVLFGVPGVEDPRFWVIVAGGGIAYSAVASRFLSATLRGHVRVMLRAPLSWSRHHADG